MFSELIKHEDYFNIPLDRYYMEETLAPKAQDMISVEREAYVTVKIKDGKSVLSGLYVEGQPIEESLTKTEK